MHFSARRQSCVCEVCQEIVIIHIWSIPTVVGKKLVCFSWL